MYMNSSFVERPPHTFNAAIFTPGFFFTAGRTAATGGAPGIRGGDLPGAPGGVVVLEVVVAAVAA